MKKVIIDVNIYIYLPKSCPREIKYFIYIEIKKFIVGGQDLGKKKIEIVFIFTF